MGLFDKLKQRVADAAQAKLDEFAAMVADLPPGTIWAGNAEIEFRDGSEVRGLLSHDGETVRFTPFRGDFAWTAHRSAITYRRGNAKVALDGIEFEIDSVFALSRGWPIELPPFADIDELDGPLCGFFSTLRIPV
ncbi:MAG: hypothetical protein AAGA90_05625 [Actinomycetota bacterium]